MMTTAHVLLRERGIPVTAQRLAVMEAVAASKHATAEMIADHSRQSLGSISRQSVYDTLDLLIAEGLVRRIQPVGSPARYEDRVGDNHHHIACRICGALADVDCAVGHAPCLTASDNNGFDIDEAEIIYWGRCPECRQKDLEATPLHPPLRRTNDGARA